MSLITQTFTALKPRAGSTNSEVLTSAEEIDLARRVEAGVLARHAVGIDAAPAGASRTELAIIQADGDRAFRHFVESNLALVGMVVHQESSGYGGLGADLFQDGCLGLIEAVRRFDHARGCRFATYALFWIRAYVRASTATRGGQLNVTVSRAERLRRARGLQGSLSQQLGREATAAEVGVELGRSADWVAGLLAHQLEASLDEGSAERHLPDDRAAHDVESILDEAMPGEELLDQLDPADRQVIRLRFGFTSAGQPQSYVAIARAVGLTVRQVRRAEHRALEDLRGRCPQQARVHLS